MEFLTSRTIRIPNTNPRSMKRFPEVNACVCDLCKGTFKPSEVEVDHIQGNHSLKSMEDLQKFVQSIIETDMEGLQIACKDCHKTKSHAEKKGISFNEAKAEKIAIALVKSKKDKEWLLERGITPDSTGAKRRKQIEKEVLDGQT